MRMHHPGKTPAAGQPGRTATPASRPRAAIYRSAGGAVPGGRGQPLAVPVTERMTARLGGDSSHVPVYTDSAARAAAAGTGALVYTFGAHVAAGDGGAGNDTPAVQRSIGNAAVSRMLERARHQHGAGGGQQQTAPAPVRRSVVHDVLSDPGQPLAAPVKQEMEARLGADFSHVRVHTDGAAHTSAAEMGARAYTSGSHIVIGDRGADKHTLAHELIHVIQQRQGPVEGTDIGDAMRLSQPSDRDERAAKATAQRALAGPVPVRRDQAEVAGPRSGPADGRPVQRVFKVATKEWNSGNIAGLEGEKVWTAKGVPKHWTEEQKSAVWNQIENMAQDTAYFEHFRSYQELVKKADGLVNQAAAANLPKLRVGSIKTGVSQLPAQGSSAMEIEIAPIAPEAKIHRLGELRRKLSLRAIDLGYADFRNRQESVSGFQYMHPNAQLGADIFSIGHTSNFLLGGLGFGRDQHAYKDLFENALRASGLTNQQAAERLFIALTDVTQDPFKDLPSAEGVRYLTKIVGIIQGAEFRRAAANPLAAIAAFRKVMANPNLNLADTLAEATIFAAPGGSSESQYHRNVAILQTDEGFKARAEGEYDAIAKLLTLNGWNGQDEEQFYEVADKVGATAMSAFGSTWVWDQ